MKERPKICTLNAHTSSVVVEVVLAVVEASAEMQKVAKHAAERSKARQRCVGTRRRRSCMFSRFFSLTVLEGC